MGLRATRQYADVLGPGDGAARVTRQFAEVLGPGDGSLRVTRQYLEVLGYATIQEGPAADTLALTDTAGASLVPSGTVYEASAADSLDLTHAAEAHTQYERAVEDAIVFAQAGQHTAYRLAAASQTLALSQTAAAEWIHGGAGELTLSGVATAAVERHRSVTQSLGLAHSVDEQGPICVAVHHVLPLQEPATGHLATVNMAVHDPVSLTGKASRTVLASATSALTFSAACVRRKTGIVHDTLSLVQTVAAGKSKLATNSLALSGTVVLEALLNRIVNDDLGLVHSGTYQLVGPSCITKQYRPFVGFSSDTEIAPPDLSAPVLAVGKLTLTYPFASPTLTVVLRNPEFANKDSLSFNRINRATRGGTLIVYADPNWPKTQKLAVEVRALKPAQVADLMELFSQSLGKEVGLVDHENRRWRGIITDPDTPVANPDRGDYTVSFEFEGEPC